MTASELKYSHETNNPDSCYFSRASMKFFGDTMANYGVKHHKKDGYYELHRKKPVKYGNQSSAYFDDKSFARVFINEG